MPAVTVSMTLNSPADAIVPGIGSAAVPAAGRWGVLMGYLTRDFAGIVRAVCCDQVVAGRHAMVIVPDRGTDHDHRPMTIAAPERPDVTRRSGLIAPDRDGPLGSGGEQVAIQAKGAHRGAGVHPHPDRGRPGRSGCPGDRRAAGSHQRRGCHRTLRRHRARRGEQRRRAGQARGGQGAGSSGNHPHADLPGRAPLNPSPSPQPPAPQPSRERLPTWRLVAAIALPVVAIIAIIVTASVINSRPVSTADDPLVVSSVEAPGATSAACTSLMAALPDPLGQLPRRDLVQGDDPLLTGVAAWGEPAVVLRCGTPTPEELTCSAVIQVVDRPVRIAFTMPDGTGTGPWQEMSRLIGGTLEQRPICVNGVIVPPDAG